MIGPNMREISSPIQSSTAVEANAVRAMFLHHVGLLPSGHYSVRVDSFPIEDILEPKFDGRTRI
jgi:hypothetical protein